MSRSLTIDLHTHVLPKSLPDLEHKFGYPGWVHLDHCCPGRARMMIGEDCFRTVEENCWSVEQRLVECDRDGVDVQVLSTVPVLFSYWAQPAHALELARYLNDDLAQSVERYPDRFVGLGTVPLQDPELAIVELERCLKIGLHGVQIGSHVNEWNLDAPELFPFFERASELGAAIFVHPWDMLARERMRAHWLSWLVGMTTETTLAICSVILGGIIDRLPNLRIAFAHGGGSFPGTLGRIEHGYEVRPDLVATQTQRPPREQIRSIYYDALVHDAAALRYLVELVGADRVALGTDYPFPLGEHQPGALIRSQEWLDSEAQQRLLGGTALEFLGLKSDRFG